MLSGLLVDLVPFDKTYQDLEHKWRNSEVSFWSSGGERRILTRSTIAAQWQRRAEDRTNNPAPPVTFGAQTKAGLLIGSFGVNWTMTTHRFAYLGAYIGEPEYWSKGYGTDALTLLVDYTFDWLDMRKIVIVTSSMNARVQRQMQKVGFTFEARLRQATFADGEWIDWLMYGLQREEWPGRDAVIHKLGLTAQE
ncbi:MAG: GNAT family N-acetyltransferase [Chloroflexi bacterium]|nr:GNAT family N-acetyltransferase [Chloroflexota bacterium]